MTAGQLEERLPGRLRSVEEASTWPVRGAGTWYIHVVKRYLPLSWIS
jgi:hypothetical protein